MPDMHIGQQVVMVDGWYSDQAIRGLYEVLRPFDREVVLAAYVAKHPHLGSPVDLTDWLVQEGYLHPLEIATWHVGRPYTSNNSDYRVE